MRSIDYRLLIIHKAPKSSDSVGPRHLHEAMYVGIFIFS